MSGEWISVEERLPEKKSFCLVYGRDHKYCKITNVATFSPDERQWWGADDAVWTWEITHWMLWPEDPE